MQTDTSSLEVDQSFKDFNNLLEYVYRTLQAIYRAFQSKQ